MAIGAARARRDPGRMVMIPLAAGIAVIDTVSLAHHAAGGLTGWLRWLGEAATCAFYAVIVWSYLRRGPALATSRSVTAHASAVLATLTPFGIPLLPAAPPGPGWQFAADALLAGGTAWSVWSMYCLGTSLSVLAQARNLADRGPYRWVRHPLYAGEIVSTLGLAITAWSPAAACLWLLLCVLQGYRALREEQVLLRSLPGYRAYRARTAAILPGIF